MKFYCKRKEAIKQKQKPIQSADIEHFIVIDEVAKKFGYSS